MTSLGSRIVLANDRRIRARAFRVAEKILKKIERIEARLAAYHQMDQTIFSDWISLRFRNERAEVEELTSKSKELHDLYGSILATKDMLRISEARAYRLMIEEADRYAQGDWSIREAIEEQRRRRDEYIRRKHEGEQQYSFQDYFGDELWFGEDPASATWQNVETEEDAAFLRIKMMTDHELQEICSRAETALEVLSTCFFARRNRLDIEVFLRVWDQVPSDFQSEFSREFVQITGNCLSDQIEIMREDLCRTEDSRGKERIFQSSADPEAEERFKLLYRKLVRLLHPDVLGAEVSTAPSSWQARMWHRLQGAKARQNYFEILKMYMMTLLRQRKLNDLTIAEIKESRLWLEEELILRQKEEQQSKRDIAWGFSRKRSYEAAEQRVRRNFARQLAKLTARIDQLESRLSAFECAYRYEAGLKAGYDSIFDVIPDATSSRGSARKRDLRSDRYGCYGV